MKGKEPRQQNEDDSHAAAQDKAPPPQGPTVGDLLIALISEVRTLTSVSALIAMQTVENAGTRHDRRLYVPTLAAYASQLVTPAAGAAAPEPEPEEEEPPEGGDDGDEDGDDNDDDARDRRR